MQGSKTIQMNTASTSVKICTLWDFMKDVRVEKMHPTVAEEFALMQKEEYKERRFSYIPDDVIISKTTHMLKQNPNSVLVELKKTTTYKERKGKSVDFRELIEDFSYKSHIEFGRPTHFFPIGENRFAFVCESDVHLFVNVNYHQSLVCTAPKRNFTLYVPNLKVRL